MFLRRAWAGAFPSRAVQSTPVLNLYCQRFARFCKMQQPIATDTATKAALLLLFYNIPPSTAQAVRLVRRGRWRGIKCQTGSNLPNIGPRFPGEGNLGPCRDTDGASGPRSAQPEPAMTTRCAGASWRRWSLSCPSAADSRSGRRPALVRRTPHWAMSHRPTRRVHLIQNAASPA
jgi:hypothetical protein